MSWPPVRLAEADDRTSDHQSYMRGTEASGETFDDLLRRQEAIRKFEQCILTADWFETAEERAEAERQAEAERKKAEREELCETLVAMGYDPATGTWAADRDPKVIGFGEPGEAQQ
jgi:hypothetical protein